MNALPVTRGDILVFTWDGPEPLGEDVLAALGVAGDPSRIDVFPASRIAPVGLDTLLVEGHGADAGSVAAVADRLEALTGTVVIAPARALGGAAMLDVAPPLTHVATLREEAADRGTGLPLDSEAARGTLAGVPGRAPKSDARISGMVATVVLIFLAVFVIAFVLMAG